MTPMNLKERLGAAWCRQTSSDPQGWSPDNPAWGQCAVTALLVQDELGGDLLWAEAQLPGGEKISHYWNLVDGQEQDHTREQFPPGTVVPAGAPKPGTFGSTRERVLSFEATRVRYDVLKQRLAALRG